MWRSLVTLIEYLWYNYRGQNLTKMDSKEKARGRSEDRIYQLFWRFLLSKETEKWGHWLERDMGWKKDFNLHMIGLQNVLMPLEIALLRGNTDDRGQREMGKVMSCTREGNGPERKHGESSWHGKTQRPWSRSRQASEGSIRNRQGSILTVSIFWVRQVASLSTKCEGEESSLAA